MLFRQERKSQIWRHVRLKQERKSFSKPLNSYSQLLPISSRFIIMHCFLSCWIAESALKVRCVDVPLLGRICIRALETVQPNDRKKIFCSRRSSCAMIHKKFWHTLYESEVFFFFVATFEFQEVIHTGSEWRWSANCYRRRCAVFQLFKYPCPFFRLEFS